MGNFWQMGNCHMGNCPWAKNCPITPLAIAHGQKNCPTAKKIAHVAMGNCPLSKLGNLSRLAIAQLAKTGAAHIYHSYRILNTVILAIYIQKINENIF